MLSTATAFVGNLSFGSLLGSCFGNEALARTDQIVWPSPGKTAQIRGSFHNSEIVITTSSRTAGAIDSLKWAGREFIDNADHGRELQSASSFDGKGECLNPTEAGSLRDGAGPYSTSRIEQLLVHDHSFETLTRMAYWVGPGDTSPGCHGATANVSSPLSDHLIQKKVTIGFEGIPNAIAHEVTFVVPSPYSQATFEILTAYMNAAFNTFWTFHLETGELNPLDHQAGEQKLPIVFATADKSHAMGVYSPTKIGEKEPTYGRFDFSNGRHPTVKWNAVFRMKDLAPGKYSFNCITFVGNIDEVRLGMSEYIKKTHP